jgi:hypothetical protein
MVDVSDSDIRCTKLSRQTTALGNDMPPEAQFSTYLIEVKSDTEVGRDLALDPVSVLPDLVDEAIDRTWTVSLTRVNADAQCKRVHRFELWVVIEGKQHAHGMVYKLDEFADVSTS